MSSVDNPIDTFYQEYQLHLDRKSIVPDRIGQRVIYYQLLLLHIFLFLVMPAKM